MMDFGTRLLAKCANSQSITIYLVKKYPSNNVFTIAMYNCSNLSTCACKCMRTYHSPPEGVGVALEVGLVGVGSHGVLLGEVDEVAGEDEAEEADVQRRDQLLKRRTKIGVITITTQNFTR